MSAAPADIHDDLLLAEVAVLGAALYDNAWLESLPNPLQPDDLATPLHSRIFECIRAIIADSGVASIFTVNAALREDSDLVALGGIKYLNSLQIKEVAHFTPAAAAQHLAEAGRVRRALEALERAREALTKPGAKSSDVIANLAAAMDSTPAGHGHITASPFQWRDPASIPPRPWVLGRWLLRCTVASVIAPGGVGKSTFLATAALSMTTGRPLLGKDVWGGKKRVWLWNLEDDGDELSRSIQAAALHYGLKPNDLDGLFVDSGLDGKGLCTAHMIDGDFRILAPVYASITAELKRCQIDVLIVDPFVSSHEIEENDNARIDKIAKAWARVAKDANCVVVLVHHASKAGSAEVTARSARGASSLVDATRSTLVLNRMDELEAQRLGIPAEERRRYLRVQDDKANRAPAEGADWFRLIGVDLGNAGGGMPADNVAVAEAWKLPDPFDDVTVHDLRAVQGRLTPATWRDNAQAKAWVGHLVAEVLGLDANDHSDKAKIKAIIAQWMRTGVIRTEDAPDSNREMRKFVVAGDPA